MSTCLFGIATDRCWHRFDVSGSTLLKIKSHSKRSLTNQNNFSFGVVVAFVTNSYLQQGVENATTTGRHGVDDTQKFLKTTSSELKHLLVTNYNQLSNHLNDSLRGISENG